jgi:hypothetical protein
VSFVFDKMVPAASARCHGPYASVDEAAIRDPAGPRALAATAGGVTEYGFVIVRDSTQTSGGYYVTPPVRASERSYVGTSYISLDDYKASWGKASCGAEDMQANTIQLVATVHTHPVYQLNDNFSPSDFTQAIDLKGKGPNVFEKIVMIYAGDHKARTFAPTVKDTPFSQAQIVYLGYYPKNNQQWNDYVKRTQIITTYP